MAKRVMFFRGLDVDGPIFKVAHVKLSSLVMLLKSKDLQPMTSAVLQGPGHESNAMGISIEAFVGIECTEMRPALDREVLPLKLLVGNESELVWPASATLKVGNHWRSADGEMLVRDDARRAETALPLGSCELELAVVAPDVAGAYLLELDLRAGAPRWFQDLGSPTLRLPISVSGGDAATASVGHAAAAHPATDPSPSSGDLPLASRIEMHVMSRKRRSR